MRTYDFRKNGKFYFEAREIQADPVLKRIAKRLKVEEGSLDVTAKDHYSAYRKFFGITPDNAIDLPDEICPVLYEQKDGFTSDDYEIIPESKW